MESKGMERRMELSTKFMQMGQSLMNEGRDNDDLGIAQVGTFMIFIAGLLISDDKDIFKFGELCSMFSSKKILDAMNNENPLSGLLNGDIDESTYDDFINRINKLKGNNDDDEK